MLAFPGIESMDAIKTGVVPLPGPNEQTIGGHALVLVGYQDDQKRFIFRNSWGTWGDGGYGYIPYEYVLNPMLAGDFWVIEKLNPSVPADSVAK